MGKSDDDTLFLVDRGWQQVETSNRFFSALIYRYDKMTFLHIAVNAGNVSLFLG